MSPTRPKNIATSVRQKLTHLSKQRGEEFQFILSAYATERLLYRFGRSMHNERFGFCSLLSHELKDGISHARALALFSTASLSVCLFLI